MFIRTREDALDTVSEILELPERRSQIIRCTVAIMQCLDWDPREFLADCQLLLISGGLEALKSKRQESFDQLRDDDLVVIIDPEENRELEAIASAFDALRLTDIVREVFPALTTRYQPWEVARAMLASESSVQEQLVLALKSRNRSAESGLYTQAFEKIDALIQSHRPSWLSRSEEIRSACMAVAKDCAFTESGPGSLEGEMLFSIVSTSDDRVTPLLELLPHNPSGAVAHLERLYELTVALRAMQQEAEAPPIRTVA